VVITRGHPSAAHGEKKKNIAALSFIDNGVSAHALIIFASKTLRRRQERGFAKKQMNIINKHFSSTG